MEYGLISILPPVIAIVLAIWSRQILISLMAGLLIGWTIVKRNLFDGFMATIDGLVDVFTQAGNTRIVIITLLMGSFIQLIRYSGGVNGFVHLVEGVVSKQRHPEKSIQVTAALTGFFIFIESNISILTVGTVFRPLFDKFKISKEKLAYIADSSSAPSCILFPLNAWGAYIMGLLVVFEGVSPFKTLIYAIPFNFYALLTFLLVLFVTSRNKSYGPMKKFEAEVRLQDEKSNEELKQGNLWDMLIPLLIMILTMPLFLIYTGWENTPNPNFLNQVWLAIGNGSGSMSVLLAVLSGLVAAGILYGSRKKINLENFVDQSMIGMKEMLSMALLMVLAFSLGALCNQLGTGTYVASVTSKWIVPGLVPAVIFITSCFIAFSTGTSWGTFAIMISIAIPVAQQLDLNLYLVTAAVLGGGVFGDHCSPISDTTLIASMATGCDHIDHVRTQLPYALFTGLISTVLYVITGFLLA